MVFFNVWIKLIIANLISLLILSIIRQIFLNCIVCEMNGSIISLKGVLTWCCTHIAILVPIALHNSINASNHYIMAKIEFTLEVKKRALDISLDYISPTRSIFIHLPLLQNWFDVFKRETHFNTITSITIFSWFHNPCIVLFFLCLVLIITNDLFCPFMVIFQKLKIFLIFHSIFDMKG